MFFMARCILYIMHLSVIIPAYNEEERIGATLKSIDEYLRSRGHDYEIIVVSDGSKDNTVQIVRNLESSIRNLRVVENKENYGKGHVVKQGMLEARGDFRLFTDADNSTSIDHIEKMMPYFKKGYGVVIGSIGVPGSKVETGSEPLWRRIFGKLGNLFIQLLAVPGIHDTQRGFKLITAKAAQDIFSKMMIERFGFDIEMLALARKFGYRIKEVPVDWKNDPNSKVGLSAYRQVLWETVKVRWYLIIGKYD